MPLLPALPWVHRCPWPAPGNRPLLLGHRGASALVTENTLAAFAAAVEQGADGVELDVRVCATGELFVFHDPDLRRLVGRGNRIAQMSLAQVRQIRLHSDHCIPTLDEVFATLPSPALVNIEIKCDSAAQIGAVVAGVRQAVVRHSAHDRVVVSCFAPQVLLALRLSGAPIASGLLFHKREPLALRGGWLAPWIGAAAVHPESPLVTAQSVARWHGRGLRVHAWTVDEPKELMRVTRLGVDAIVCNDPAAALERIAGP